MIQKIKEWVWINEKIVLALFVLLFILIRLPGTGLPLHQDEYKWPKIVNPAVDGFVPHPPVGQFIYRTAGYLVGFDTDFRFVPLFFGAINLVLLYYFVRFLFGRREALVASAIWIISYFSVLASLMVDTDGEIMPLFFLLALIGYFKLRFVNFSFQKSHLKWWAVLLLACVGGFLVKVSFLLVVGAIVADFLWLKRNLFTRRDLLKYGAYFISGLVFLTILLLLIKFIFPFFQLDKSLVYWKHFLVGFGDRGWFQTAIQCVKAILYSSPLLILVPMFKSGKDFSKLRLFMFFLAFSFIFYVILFDFSIGALDRYWQLLIVPLTIITSATLVSVLSGENSRHTKKVFLLGVCVAVFFVLLQFIPHFIPSLHPKSEWVSRALSFRWNFVYPFSGGSGPLGFYVSFLFMTLSWIVSILALVFAWWKPQYKKLALVFLIPVGLVYNGIFIEEYLVGYWNGYAPALVHNAVDFMKNNPSVSMVTAYNDNGGNEIQSIGKYKRRLYVDPKFTGQLDYLNKNKGFYFVLDVPRLDPKSFYPVYFNSCISIYNEVDKKMSATVFDCRKAPDVKI